MSELNEDLSNLPIMTLQDATIVIITMMIRQTEKLIGKEFIEESKIAPDNLAILQAAKRKQLDNLLSNLNYYKERNK